MERFRVTLEVIASNELMARRIATRMLKEDPDLWSKVDPIPHLIEDKHLPKLSDLLGLCADSPIDIAGGWEMPTNEATESKGDE
jgi:hypothetical protein